jgi:hypothetical protein
VMLPVAFAWGPAGLVLWSWRGALAVILIPVTGAVVGKLFGLARARLGLRRALRELDLLIRQRAAQ